MQVDLLVPGMHCAGCLSKIEKGFGGKPQIEKARANLGAKRVNVQFHPSQTDLDGVINELAGIGFEATPFSMETAGAHKDKTARELLLAMAARRDNQSPLELTPIVKFI